MNPEKIKTLRASCEKLAAEMIDAGVPFRVALKELKYALVLSALSASGSQQSAALSLRISRNTVLANIPRQPSQQFGRDVGQLRRRESSTGEGAARVY